MRKTLFGIALCALGAISCKKEKAAESVQETGGEAVQAAADKALKSSKAEVGHLALGQGAKMSIGSAVKHFDKDSTGLVFGLNFESVMSAKIYKDYAAQIDSQLPPEMKGVQTACGFSPLFMFKQLVISAKAKEKNAKEQEAMVWGKSIERSKLEACGKTLAEKDKKTFKVDEKDGIATYTLDDETLTVAWLDDTHFLATSEKVKPKWFKERVAGTGGLDQSAEFSSLLKNLDSSSGFWFAGGEKMMKSSMGKDLKGSSVESAKGVFGTVSLSAGIGMKGGVVFDSEKTAAKSTKQSQEKLAALAKQMPFVAAYVNKVILKSKGANMMVDFNLNEADIAALSALAGGFMGGAK